MASDGGIRIDVELDDGRVISGVADIQDRFENLRSAMTQIFSRIDNVISSFGGTLLQLGGQYERLSTNVNDATRSSDRFSDSLNDISRDINRIDVNDLSGDINRLDSSIREVGSNGTKAFDSLGKAVKGFGIAAGAAALGGTALGLGINAIVEANRELNTDLARLNTNEAVAGFGLGFLEEQFLRVAAVSGELDSAVETISQLAATDLNESQLAEAIDFINGAAIRFSDTLNTEGIADGLQETFAVGEAAGQFGELLERSGIDLEVFNKKLAKAEKQGTATDFVLQQLADLGLGDTYEAYLESNKAINEYNEAQVRSEVLTAQLAERLTPLATQYTVLKNTIIDVILGNQELSVVFDMLGNNIANLLSKLTGIDVSTFLDAFEQIKVTVQAALKIVVDTSQAALEKLKSLWSENGDEISSKASEAFNVIRDVIQDVLNAVVPFVQAQLIKIKTFWDTNGAQILAAAKSAFEGIKAVIDFVMPAIQFVIQYVWTAIQNIITGALDLIIGAVKIFSGVFTGDWDKLWEGIKHVFSGAVDLILGIMSLTFLGGIRTALVNLSKTAIALVKTKWTTIVETFKNFSGQAVTTVGNLVKNVLTFFGNLFTQGVAAITRLSTGSVNAIKNMATNMVNAIKGLPARFTQIGKDLVNGMINGIKSLVGKVKDTVAGMVDGVINTATSLLDIHSPSRVFKEIGLFTGEGLIVGLNSSAPNVNKAMENVVNGILKVSNGYQKEYQQLLTDNNKANSKKITDNNNKIAKIEATAAKAKRKLTSDEINTIAKLRRDAEDARLKAKVSADKKYLALVDKAEKDYLNVLKSYIEDKKSLDELSLVEEAAILEQSVELFVVGSAQRIAVQKDYQKAIEAVNKEVNSVNERYLNKAQEIENNYLNEFKRINKVYDDEFDKRLASYTNFADTFSDFQFKFDKSGQDLIISLQNQVNAITLYQDLFETLSNRNVDATLLDEISNLGVKALPELAALNELTDDELSKYSDLYKEKSRSARELATNELKDLRKDTDVQLRALYTTNEAELSRINQLWDAEIKGLVTNTSANLTSLKQVGRDAGQGLLNGLKELESPLKQQAQRMADAITKTIEKALDINSPSRWASDFVVGNIEKGFEVGVKKNESGFTAAATDISNAIQGPIVNPLRNTSLGLSATASSAANINTTNNVFNNGGGKSEQNVNIAPANVIIDGKTVANVIYQQVDRNTYRSSAISAYSQGVILP